MLYHTNHSTIRMEQCAGSYRYEAKQMDITCATCHCGGGEEGGRGGLLTLLHGEVRPCWLLLFLLLVVLLLVLVLLLFVVVLQGQGTKPA